MKVSATRSHIVQTASELFYKNGYNATGINEIIAESGIAKATLYNHFKSKKELCIAYLEHKNSTFKTDIKQYCLAKPSGKEQILALFDYLKEFYQQNDFNGCWCIKTVAEIPTDEEVIREEIQNQKLQLIKFIESLLESNINVTEKTQLASMARRIYLLYEGAVSESHLHRADWPIIEAKNICAHIIQ
ncbi:MAG: TetR/AcrR family transcriptional regulator [Flavobacteriales bacterium]|nr:TetR/AcrR family transcriptional regulator [Flavobacteriales bacterium]